MDFRNLNAHFLQQATPPNPCNLFKQVYFLVTKHSSVWAYGGHFYLNYHEQPVVLATEPSLRPSRHHLFTDVRVLVDSHDWENNSEKELKAGETYFIFWLQEFQSILSWLGCFQVYGEAETSGWQRKYSPCDSQETENHIERGQRQDAFQRNTSGDPLPPSKASSLKNAINLWIHQWTHLLIRSEITWSNNCQW